ncbi:MAG: hypothetical protein Q8N18_17140 [Opitutaceae bacterium]|nr:hypothetical protein [Opitutaceae bacterium]
MKITATASKSSRVRSGTRTAGIVTALRDARKNAVKLAKMHNTPVVYLRAGTLARART